MSLSSSQARIKYTLSGASQTLTVPFKFISAADLRVVRTRGTTDVVLALNTDYSVTGGGGIPATGAITMAATSATTGDIITIARAADLTQPAIYAANDAFPAKTNETALDRLTMYVQQLALSVARAVRIPVSNQDTQTPEAALNTRAGRLVGFDGSGNLNTDVKRDDVLTLIAANPLAVMSSAVDYGTVGDPATNFADYGSIA